MQLIDLCSGIGGFSLAAKWLGWETIAFCERDLFCQKVLEKNFPGVPIYDDVFTFPSSSFRGGRDTILSAGFPCQPFSQAGKRLGREDERHLFPQILDIVATIRPAICVFENVRGLLSIESGHVFAEVVTSLEREGYEVITFCIPASALNAPHRRDRLWIIARRDTVSPYRESNVGDAESDTSSEVGEIQKGANAISRGSDDATRNTFSQSTQIEQPRTVGSENGQTKIEGRTSILDSIAHSSSNASNPTSDGHTFGHSPTIGTQRQSEQGRMLESEGNDRVTSDARCKYGQSGRDDRMATDTPKRSHSESDVERCGEGAKDEKRFIRDSKGSGQPSGTDRQGQIEYGRTGECDAQLKDDARYTDSLTVQGEWVERDSEDSARLWSGENPDWSTNWVEVATEFCRVDDGSAVDLDGFKLSASKHRENRLKALGNGIVVPLAFEIFKAIQEAQDSNYGANVLP